MSEENEEVNEEIDISDVKAYFRNKYGFEPSTMTKEQAYRLRERIVGLEREKDKNITLTVDRSEEMKNLQDEVSSLKGKLALIAEKEFNAQRLKVAKKLGCSVEDIKTPEDLKRAKETARRIEQQGEGSGQSTLSYSEAIGEDNASDMSIDVPLQWRSYDSYEDLVNSLKKIAENPEHEDHKEAQTYLKALTKKAMRQKHSQVELEGNLKDALRKRQNKKKRAKFRKVK